MQLGVCIPFGEGREAYAACRTLVSVLQHVLASLKAADGPEADEEAALQLQMAVLAACASSMTAVSAQVT